MAIANRLMTALFDVCFAPFVGGPGWVSLVVFSALASICGLLVYKYTSNQAAIKRTKDRIKAHILAIKLFKDDLGVIMGSLVRVMGCAALMLRYALLPLALMIVPFLLVMAQLGLRYQWRPLLPDERVALTAELADGRNPMHMNVSLEASAGVVVEAGPVRKPATGEVTWRLRGTRAGRHLLRVHVGNGVVEKTLVVGEGFERVSLVRSRGSLWERVLHPSETPLPPDCAVSAIRIAYPHRDSWLYGANYWLAWLIVLSFALAYLFKPVLDVEF